MPDKVEIVPEAPGESGRGKKKVKGKDARNSARTNQDDIVDAVLFVNTDDEAIDEEEEEDDWEDEDEEIDPCLEGGENDGEEEDEEEAGATGQGAPEEPSPEARERTSNRFRRHHFIKHEICVPDKTRKYRPPPKGKPWYLHKKKTLLEKRQESSIAFNMPKQEDPQVIALRKTNKMVQKLIKYMKKSWKVRVERQQEERELEHRTLASVYTTKPSDWLEKIRSREEKSLETGFFSPLDIPYEALIDLEIDTALLTFKNLPPDLKITAARWIRTKLRKEELKRKRDAYLPHLAHGKVKRPSYNKGRLIKDPGGVKKVDQFAKVAEAFHKVTKGNTPFSKVLKEWSQKKEKESYSMNSGFGVVREGMFDFSRKDRTSKEQALASNQNKSKDVDTRRVSIVDARKYQRDMLFFEKFMMSIYDIMKSLLNIKMKQLESKFPLPPTAVFQIREHSPDSTDRPSRMKKTPMLVVQRNNAELTRASRASVFGLGQRSFTFDGRKSAFGANVNSDKTSSENEDSKNSENNNPIHVLSHGKLLSQHPSDNINSRASISQMGNKARRKSDVKDIIAKQGGPEGLKVEDIVNLSPVRTSEKLIDDLKREHSFQDMMEMKKKKTATMLTAEQKIKRLAENPEHAAIRRARNYMTYNKLFERNKKIKPPVWHNIDIATMAMDFNKAKGTADKDPANLTEADGAEIVEMALKKRKTMSRKTFEGEDEEETNKRWPDEYDIPTPTFPFPHSKIKIPSEEQSRLNLLKKTPHTDEVPSTPVRRLYKLAGVRTTEMDIFNNIMEMKRMFRVTENKLRVYYENEIGKLDWDTLKRFRCKLSGIQPSPVYQWTISLMRFNQEQPIITKATGKEATEKDDEDLEEKKLKQKRPALWYKKLKEEAEINGATRHNACHTELQRLMKYCDVDMKTKPHMLNRLALLTVSLPTTELGTKHWQQAITFLLEHMFGTPPTIIHHWLRYRGIPYLL